MVDRSKQSIGTAGAVALVSALVLAGQGVGADAQAQHKAHEHGVGHLNIAVEGKEVEMELTAPGADIVGFEHEPSTADQKKAVSTAVATLKNGGKIFGFPAAAECKMEEVEVASALMEEGDHHDDHKDHKDHDHDHAKEAKHHDDHKGHKDHDDHAKEAKHHDDHKDHDHGKEGHAEKSGDHDHDHEKEGETHAEFRVHYHFECEHPERLTHIDVRYFQQFPNAKELESQVIGAKGQTAAELTPASARLKF